MAISASREGADRQGANGQAWFLLNVSADVRAQLASTPELWPPEQSLRGTPIAGCVLTDAEIDHASGLLQLREGCSFGIYSTARVRRWLATALPIGPILATFAERDWHELPLATWIELRLPDGTPSGLRSRAFELEQDVPRFVNEPASEAVGSRIGLEIVDDATRSTLVYAPGIAGLGDSLRAAAAKADCLLVDGTFWSLDEPAKNGIHGALATDLGHLPIDGPQGSLAWLAALPARHRAYVHINNTNPILDEHSPEHRQVLAAGVAVARDGDGFEI